MVSNPFVSLARVELASRAPEAGTLSTELQGQPPKILP